MLRTIYRLIFLTLVAVLFAVSVVNVQGNQWLDDPGQLGHYAIGHTSYQFVDQNANNRPVFVSVLVRGIRTRSSRQRSCLRYPCISRPLETGRADASYRPCPPSDATR